MSFDERRPVKFFEGSWSKDVRWEFYKSSDIPDRSLCTAVSCIAIVNGGKEIVLARNERGWELLGGHIEPLESIEEALYRESLEEGGFQITHFRLFGHLQIRSVKPIENTNQGGLYPALSYMPYFLAVSDVPLIEPTGSEVFERKVVAVDQLAELKIAQANIVELGLEVYHRLGMAVD